MNPLLVMARFAVLLLIAVLAAFLLALLVGTPAHGAPAPTWDRRRLQETRWSYHWNQTPYLLIFHADGRYEGWCLDTRELSWHGAWEWQWNGRYPRLVMHDEVWGMDFYLEPTDGGQRWYSVVGEEIRARFVMGSSGSTHWLTFTRVPFKR